MKKTSLLFLSLLFILTASGQQKKRTVVSIRGNAFYINNTITYKNRTWNGHRIEGLLMNSRMVQGTFDDYNKETRSQFAYPDTGEWDPERNTNEFIAAMDSWKKHGLLAFTLNLQGGSPMGYGNKGWKNSAFDEHGELRPDYLSRLERILNKADEYGMVVILGYFYFGQDETLKDDTAVIRATDNATDWVLKKGYRNILVEVNNECNIQYDHNTLKPERVHELILRVRNKRHKGRSLLAGTSYGGGTIPQANVARASDFLLLHGNGVDNPAVIREMVKKTQAVEGYRGQPILFNEDDHFEFEKPENNFIAAVESYASWGYFDFRKQDGPLTEGFQTVPVDWTISSPRKKAFFNLLKEITGF